MNTIRMLSAISWNTETSLKDTLDDLISRNIITFYYYIYHLAETVDGVDEKKNHFHIFLIPNTRLNTDKLRDEFDEIDPNNSLPIRISPFRVVGKFADKYLYDLHDKDYLLSKGTFRKYHYKHSDFKCSDEAYFNELVNEIDYSKFKGLDRFKKAIMTGMSFDMAVVNGLVPPQQFSGYKNIYECLKNTRLQMIDGQLHDTWTGEIIDSDFKTEKNVEDGFTF